ncbi:hypothetical protein [Sulfobacillus harzensis]|uniref:Uncharacterized protein n=1 Tax=Sulfobacillus harzensis TaxID=2729629 RepID=A0A7Y0L2Z3_9FIRM|nr:hypothetical protein [Sulfobacillus harzensis]NMP22343.1 hypothetical protein [Sulfobacillus harzensis]
MEERASIWRFWADNANLGLATVVAGLFNTLFSLILAHALGPKDYGWVAALNSLVSLFLLPLPVIGLAAIRWGKPAAGRSGLVVATWALGGGIFLLAAALSPVLGRGLELPSSLITLFSLSVLFNFGYVLYIGYLERARRYRLVGVMVVLSSVLGVAAVALAVTAGRAHPIFWLGALQAAGLAVLLWLARRSADTLPPVPPSRISSRILATTLGVGTLQSLWGLADSLWAKANLHAHAAGIYTGLVTVGQAVPFVVSSLATVMLTAVLEEPARRRYFLARTLVAALALDGIFLSILALMPKTIVRLALGSAFLPMTPLIQHYGDAMAALALVSVLATYGVAVGAYGAMIGAALGTGFWIVSLGYAHAMASLVSRTLESMVLTLGLTGMGLLVDQKGRR